MDELGVEEVRAEAMGTPKKSELLARRKRCEHWIHATNDLFAAPPSLSRSERRPRASIAADLSSSFPANFQAPSFGGAVPVLVESHPSTTRVRPWRGPNQDSP
jgi:hypothetical protein